VSYVALVGLFAHDLISVLLVTAVAFVKRMKTRKESLVSSSSLVRLFTFPLPDFPFSRSLSIDHSTSIISLSSSSLRSCRGPSVSKRELEIRFALLPLLHSRDLIDQS